MPLSFQSQTHGTIAFGFFNIESDMLLLENYFFFAEDFCSWIQNMASEKNPDEISYSFPSYFIENPADIGDLMGAIHGIRFQGFIGELYKRYPFPEEPAAFKQNPEGYRTRSTVKLEIENVAQKTDISFKFMEGKQIQIGPILFDKLVFHELIRYVWQGGYPRWKNEVRPQYVMEMKTDIQNSKNEYFQGIF